MVILGVTAGKRPARPPHREVLGLDDAMWNVVQQCWDANPQSRPTIKDVRSFLGPASWKWSPLTSEEIDRLSFDSAVGANISTYTCMCSNVKYCDICQQAYIFSTFRGLSRLPRDFHRVGGGYPLP